MQQPEFSKSEQGKSFLESIKETGRSKLHDPISVHLILNVLLRPDSQVAPLPVLAFKDRELDLSEREFVGACRNLDLLPGAKTALGTIFEGKVLDALDRTMTHRGELFFDFFLKPKNTSYRRGSVLMNPAKNTDRHLYDLDSGRRILTELERLDEYTSADKTLCRLLAECLHFAKESEPELATAQGLLDRISTFQDGLPQLLGNPGPTMDMGGVSTDHPTNVQSMAEAIKSKAVELQREREALSNMSKTQKRQLLDVIRHGLQSGSRSGAENGSRRHYVPTGNIKTNGHTLQVLAYDLTTLRPKNNTSKSNSSNTSSALRHGLPVIKLTETSTAQHQDQPMDAYDMELWGTDDPDFLEGLSGVEAGHSNEGADTHHGHLAQGPALTTHTVQNQNSFAGAKASAMHAKTLPYVRNLYPTRHHVQSLGGSDFIGIGVDPGRAKPASVVAVHTKYPNLSQTLDITDTAAKDIQRRYMSCLNSKRKTREIDTLEGTLVSSVALVQVKVTQEGDTTACAWKAAADALYKNHLQWLRPRLDAFKKLRDFYGTIDFKKDLYDLKTAIRSDRGSISSAAIKMAHIPHPKIPLSEIQEYRNTPAVLGIGDGAFGGRQEKTLDNMAREVSVGGFDFRIETPKISVLMGGSVHSLSIL